MSHSVRFLTLAIAAWAGVRAITLGLDPGRDALAATLDDSQLSEAAQGPTAPASASPPSTPGMQVSTMAYAQNPYGWMPAYPPPWAYPAAPPPAPVIRIVQSPAAAPSPGAMAIPAYYYGTTSAYSSQTLPSGLAYPEAASMPTATASMLPLSTPPLQPQELVEDRRLRGHVWGHYRQDTSGLPSLAPGGTLGGSQAGVRLLYRVAPGLDLSARNVGSLGNFAGSEAALGVRYAPFANLPLAITAERRQRVHGFGRSDFAAFAEYGAYGVAMPAGFTADGFAQAGMVGLDGKGWFLDAQLAATRPLYRDMRLGAGVWTAAQRGLSRVDIGPRLTVPVGNQLALHADYRVNVAGNAAPGSGATITFAKDF